MGVLRKKDFGISPELIRYLLEEWEIERVREIKASKRRRHVGCVEATVVPGY